MDIKKLLKTGGTIAGLSFVSALISSLFLCFSISSKGFRITSAIILLLLSLVILYLGFFKADSKSPKATYICVGFCDLFTGILWFFINNTFHTRDSYLNRLVIYALFTISYSITLACFWSFITRKVFGALLAEHQIDEKQETLLYVVVNMIYGLVIALVVPISSATSVSALCTAGIKYSVGFWFVIALIGFLIGFLLSKSSYKEGPQSIVTPISQDAAYDGIN